MYTPSISPTWWRELDLHHLNGETVQPMPCHPQRPFAHGRQETKLQLDLGQHRQATTSLPQSTFSRLILG
jgi:hypothetical protein